MCSLNSSFSARFNNIAILQKHQQCFSKDVVVLAEGQSSGCELSTAASQSDQTQAHTQSSLASDSRNVGPHDLPSYFRASDAEYNHSYNKQLVKSDAFQNSACLSLLCKRYQIAETGNDTFINSIKRKNFDRCEYALPLRKAQSERLAIRSVAKGVERFRAGHSEEAIQHFNRALQVDAENVEALVARGALHANGSSFALAIKDFEAALRHAPTHANARKYLAQTLIAQSKTFDRKVGRKKLIDVVKRAKELWPEVGVNIEELSRRKNFEKITSNGGAIVIVEETSESLGTVSAKTDTKTTAVIHSDRDHAIATTRHISAIKHGSSSSSTSSCSSSTTSSTEDLSNSDSSDEAKRPAKTSNHRKAKRKRSRNVSGNRDVALQLSTSAKRKFSKADNEITSLPRDFVADSSVSPRNKSTFKSDGPYKQDITATVSSISSPPIAAEASNSVIQASQLVTPTTLSNANQRESAAVEIDARTKKELKDMENFIKQLKRRKSCDKSSAVK